MTDSSLDVESDLIRRAESIVGVALTALSAQGGVDKNQTLAYDIAHVASALAAARACLLYAAQGEVEAKLFGAFLAHSLRDFSFRVSGNESIWNVDDDWFNPFREYVAGHHSASFLSNLAESPGPRHLGDDFESVAVTFHRFAEREVRPHAEHVHRTNSDIPESIVDGLNALGGFGLSIPEQFGGSAVGDGSEYVGIVVATEELSWGSLGIGGSLITRQEILARALLSGGTEDQRREWLPRLANAQALCAVAVTEPDFGSDVAAIATTATKVEGGWLINGTKTWSTFAARAEVLMVLARTNQDRALSHRGLSAFLIEKPVSAAIGFALRQDSDGDVRAGKMGRLEGWPIDTIGYRGMHSYELSFSDWFVPDCNVVGGEGGVGRGFYIQMSGFEGGRIQTAARAVGVMQAAYESALDYARARIIFGTPLIDYELTRTKLALMAAIIQCTRQFSLSVARQMGNIDASLEASMAKAYACLAAEWVTREAMQIHGGMGYAEEYAVSRYFVDSRVLSIFEGADEVLCLKVIVPRLLEKRESKVLPVGEN
jgi:(2S)-methylsuccinyl-CoA dehydrogenase